MQSMTLRRNSNTQPAPQQDRDSASLDALFQRHAALAYHIALRQLGHPADAEDAVQAAFCVALQRQGQLRQHESMRGWIVAIVLNICRSKIRDERCRRRHEESRGALRLADVPCEPERRELAAAALRILNTMPDRYRLPVELHCVGGFSYDEVAAALAQSEETVRRQTNRGLVHLRKALAGAGLLACTASLPQILSAVSLTPAPLSLTTKLKSRGTGEPKSSALASRVKMLALAGAAASVALAICMSFGASRRHISPSAPAADSVPVAFAAAETPAPTRAEREQAVPLPVVAHTEDAAAAEFSTRIQDLDSGDPQRVAVAEAALKNAGEAARPALVRAITAGSAAVKSRAGKLLAVLNTRSKLAEILTRKQESPIRCASATYEFRFGPQIASHPVSFSGHPYSDEGVTETMAGVQNALTRYYADNETCEDVPDLCTQWFLYHPLVCMNNLTTLAGFTDFTSVREDTLDGTPVYVLDGTIDAAAWQNSELRRGLVGKVGESVVEQRVSPGSVRVQIDRFSLLTLKTEIRGEDAADIAFGHFTGLSTPAKHVDSAQQTFKAAPADATPLTLAGACGRFGESQAKKMAAASSK